MTAPVSTSLRAWNRLDWQVRQIPPAAVVLAPQPPSHFVVFMPLTVGAALPTVKRGVCDFSWQLGRRSAAHGSTSPTTAGRGVHRKLPHLGDAGMGQLPRLGGRGGSPEYGVGIHANAYRSSIREIFSALSARLRGVRVACGDFERVLSDSVTWRHGTSAILLDPPYADGEEVYSSENGASVFARAARWAEEHWTHPDLRIALCYYEGTWTPPAGGETIAWKAKGGYGGQRKEGKNENADRERIAFSPACLRPEVKPAQGSLFGSTL